MSIKDITVQELKRLQDRGTSFQLIDVREPWEYEICNLGGVSIPMEQALEATQQVARDKKVIVHCYRGHRSAQVIEAWEKALGLKNLYNLRGGLLAYAEEIDPSLPTY